MGMSSFLSVLWTEITYGQERMGSQWLIQVTHSGGPDPVRTAQFGDGHGHCGDYP